MKNKFTDLEVVLQQWRITTPLPPRFQEHVWSRIERTDSARVSVGEALRAWFYFRFAQPAVAAAYLSLLVAAGLALGFYQASQKNARWEQQLEARYVRSVDPYQQGH